MERKVGDDFIAILKYQAELGHLDPKLFNYQLHIKFPPSKMFFSGRIIFIDKDVMYTGDIVRAYIKILGAPNLLQKSLCEGMEFEFSKASTFMGTGKIIPILNLDLKKDGV
jgi:hypothetical protein